MADPYAANRRGILGPYDNAAVVTPHDSNDLETTPAALWVGGAGAVKIDTAGGQSAVLIASVPAGTLLLVRATRVYATDTDATNIVALW